eukprot:COSAG02_NODE_3559_length_6563_cov_4.152382_4_plen_60_part_00
MAVSRSRFLTSDGSRWLVAPNGIDTLVPNPASTIVGGRGSQRWLFPALASSPPTVVVGW